MLIIMFITGAIQLVMGLVVLLQEFKRGSLSVFLWAGLLVMFHIPHFVTSCGINIEYPIWSYIMASMFASAFVFFYLATMKILIGTGGNICTIVSIVQSEKELSIIDRRYEKYYYSVIIVSTIITVLYIRSIAGSLLQSSWSNILLDKPPNTILLILFTLIPFFIDVAGGIFIYYFPERKRRWNTVFLGVLVLFSIFIRREKQRFLVLAVPIILILYMKNRKIKLSTIFKYLVIFIAGYFIVLVLAYMRDGTLGDFISSFSFSNIWNYSIISLSTSSGELGLRNAFYKFIANRNNFAGFNTGAEYLRMLLFWVPTRFSFGIKPSDFACTMGSAWLDLGPQDIYSMHPTLYGSCFANFNYFGIFLAIFWAVLLYFFERIVYTKKKFLMRCGLSVLLGINYIMIARGSAYNAIFTIIVGYIFLEVVDFFMSIRWL